MSPESNPVDCGPGLRWGFCGALLVFAATSVVVAEDEFRRGDVNGDGRVEIVDLVEEFDALFLGGTFPCSDAGDLNDDGGNDVMDGIHLMNFLYIGGPPPAPPGAYDCGADPSPDFLPPCEYPEAVCLRPEEPSLDEDFELSFWLPNPPIPGAPGATVTVEDVRVVLELAGAGRPVRAWSLSVTPTGGTVTNATTAGTAAADINEDPNGMRDSGFENTQVVGGGVVSAVVLSFPLPIALEGPGAYDVLSLDVEVDIPAGGECPPCLLEFGPLQGSGEEVPNVVESDGNGFQPVLRPTLIFVECEVGFRRGDVNGDGRVEVVDSRELLDYMFMGAGELPCPDAADVNDDGMPDLIDVISLLMFLFVDGAPPHLPGPDECGPDPSPDFLPDCFYPEAVCAEPEALAPDQAFELSFSLPPLAIRGVPGATFEVSDIRVQLEIESAERPVKAWSLSVEASGCSVTSATTAGTVAANAHIEGFDQTEVVDDGSGAVSAVVLSFTQPTALEVGRHDVLSLNVEAEIPAAGGCPTCELKFNALQGSGEEVPNLVESKGDGFQPILGTAEIPIGGAPEAVIDGPDEAVFLGPGPATVFLDGTRSTAPGGGPALIYSWSATDPEVHIASPRGASTLVSFTAPGTEPFEVLLEIRDFGCDNSHIATHTILVRRPEEQPVAPPAFVALRDEVLTLPALSPFALELALARANPVPEFAFVGDPPTGLELAPSTGRLSWVPSLGQIGEHSVTVAATNSQGTDSVALVVSVLDSTEIEALYAVRPEDPPPDGSVLGDGAPLLPPLDLQRSLARGSSAEAVELVSPGAGGGDFLVLRFDPEAGGVPGADSSFGAVYRSGASASKLFDNVLATGEHFTIELWLSKVPDAQVGGRNTGDGEPATIFAAMSEDGTEASWLVGKHDGGDYLLRVRTNPAQPTDVELAVTADFSSAEPHHLVFVREEGRHVAYVDGNEVPSFIEDAGALAWDRDHELVLGNKASLTNPFTGGVHLAGFYNAALSPAHVLEIFLAGPSTTPDVAPPVLMIDPDPEIIGRGVRRLQASALPFGEGEGAGGQMESCGDLRAMTWSVVSVTPAREDVEIRYTPTAAVCDGAAELHYDPDVGPFEVTVEAEVSQVPVRGITASRIEVQDFSFAPLFLRGDCNGDGTVSGEVTDAVVLLDYNFTGGPEPPCLAACEANGDGEVDVSDSVYLLIFNFLGGEPPPPPFPECGKMESPSDVALGCNTPPLACE